MTKDGYLLDKLGVDYEKYVITVNQDTREMDIPAGASVFGVTNDQNSSRKWFCMKTQASEDFSLKDKAVYVNFMNPNGGKDSYLPSDITFTDDGYTILSWELSRSATYYKGSIQFLLCARDVNSTGAVTAEWHTALGAGVIKQGLEVDTIDPPQSCEDLIAELTSQIKRTGAAVEEEVVAKGEEVKKSIPSDYSALSEQVSICLYVDDEGYLCFE